VAFILGVLLLFVYAGAVSFVARDIADYAQPGFREFFFYVRESWKEGLAFGCIATAHIALSWSLSRFIRR
jgi:NADH:ubiquinone oxidoreductase subunit 6 (subunit J)